MNGYDYAMLQTLLSESQNRMMRRLERANRRFEQAMEGLDEGRIKNSIKK